MNSQFTGNTCSVRYQQGKKIMKIFSAWSSYPPGTCSFPSQRVFSVFWSSGAISYLYSSSSFKELRHISPSRYTGLSRWMRTKEFYGPGQKSRVSLMTRHHLGALSRSARECWLNIQAINVIIVFSLYLCELRMAKFEFSVDTFISFRAISHALSHSFRLALPPLFCWFLSVETSEPSFGRLFRL